MSISLSLIPRMATDSLNSSVMTNAACPQIPNAPVRILASGKCTFILTTGRLKFYCPCDKGTFHLSSVDSDKKCERCEHTLNFHEDAVSSAVSQSTKQGWYLFPLFHAVAYHIAVMPGEDGIEIECRWIGSISSPNTYSMADNGDRGSFAYIP